MRLCGKRSVIEMLPHLKKVVHLHFLGVWSILTVYILKNQESRSSDLILNLKRLMMESLFRRHPTNKINCASRKSQDLFFVIGKNHCIRRRKS